jgi:hypothetical protein
MTTNEAVARDGIAAFNSGDREAWLAFIAPGAGSIPWTSRFIAERAGAPPVEMPLGGAIKVRPRAPRPPAPRSSWTRGGPRAEVLRLRAS